MQQTVAATVRRRDRFTPLRRPTLLGALCHGWSVTGSTSARLLAEGLLASMLPDRWRHVGAVAARTEEVTASLDLRTESLVSAAWLHDVGYSPRVRSTGFHPLDGARYLVAQGVDDRVTELVAHHSFARVEAQLRGLEGELLKEFPVPDSELADVLCFCDMTVGPQGQAMTADDRLAEIRERYGPGDLVTRFIDQAEAPILDAVQRVTLRLEKHQSR